MEYKIVTTSRNGQALYFQKQLYYKLQPKDPVTGVIRALSLLFLRPIKCYSSHNIAFNVNTSQMSGYPIYLSLKDVHFIPIVPLNQNFQIADTTGDHLNFIKYGVGDLDFY